MKIRFKGCTFYAKDGSKLTKIITGSAASDKVDYNWLSSLSYKPIIIKDLGDIYLLVMHWVYIKKIFGRGPSISSLKITGI